MSKTNTAINNPLRLQEKHYQKQVLDLFLLKNWLVYHDFYSLRNAKGFLDTVVCREGRNGQQGRLVFLEIKVKGGRLRPEQKQWVAALKTVPGIEVYVVYLPDDWDEVMRIAE